MVSEIAQLAASEVHAHLVWSRLRTQGRAVPAAILTRLAAAAAQIEDVSLAVVASTGFSADQAAAIRNFAQAAHDAVVATHHSSELMAS